MEGFWSLARYSKADQERFDSAWTDEEGLEMARVRRYDDDIEARERQQLAIIDAQQSKPRASIGRLASENSTKVV